MALKFPAIFLLFSPSPAAPSGRPVTEVHLSRWNNANAEPFLRRRRRQQEIEDDLRRGRRFQSALKIAADESTSADPARTLIPPRPAPPAPAFKSRGTPSAPSSPSIPGKASKYSKPPLDPKPKPNSHPAFRRVPRGFDRVPPEPGEETGISLGEKGIAYRVKDAPFEFQYSYTETPKVKPLALREPPILPFGPTTMPRPWTGRAPLPPSKKKLPEFDSFKLPPPGKKGVKPVQSPGPFLAGAGPKYHAASREEILGEPLSKEEIKELVKGCLKTKRQLNMGRDGLTHNMLDNIHAHWKRRRVCKIKCKGVCTVDMDNVHQQLEEKTGGKIIYTKGGVVFLFRGRNYNYRTRPRYPLMLWKPVTPVYPRLVQRVPEGLTLEEATEMRKRGRQLPPICKLGKNGVYHYLVKQVKEAFEACELVRIDCKGLNKSDCRKIGAKLKDLVPCVLLSFEFEHILMWRGKDWKSSLPPPADNHSEGAKLIASDPTTTSTSAADSLASEQDVLGAGADEEFSYESSLENTNLDELLGVGGTDHIPNLENISHPLPFSAADLTKITDEAFDSSSVLHLESSFAVQHEALASDVGDNSKESCCEIPCEKVSLKEISNLEAKGIEKLSLPPLEDKFSEGAELIASDLTTYSTSDADSLLSEQDILSAGARSADEEFSYKSSLENMTLDGHQGVGGTKDLPNLENISHPSPFSAAESTKMTVKLSDFSSVMHRESSFVIQQGMPSSDPGTNSEESCLEMRCRQVSLNEISSLEEKGKNISYSAVEGQVLEACTVGSTRIKNSGVVTGVDNDTGSRDNLGTEEANSLVCQNSMRSGKACLEQVRLLLKQAVESGTAVILDESLDANIVYERAVALAKTAPPGPVFLHKIRKAAAVQKTDEQNGEKQEQDSDIEVKTISEKRHHDRKNIRGRRRDEFQETLSDVVPHGSLKVDELAKLLA